MYGFRRIPKESLTLEVVSGVDGQAKETYDSPVDIEGHVVRSTNVIHNPAGQEVKTIATIWIDGTQDPLPNHNDRLTVPGGLVGIVVERVEGRPLRNATVDHIRIQIREE